MFAVLVAKVGPILARAAWSLLIAVLQKTGTINKVEATAAKAEHAFVGTVEHIKRYQSFPTGKNGASSDDQT